LWDKLKNSYERDEKVNQAKLQAFRMLFESLIMKEEDGIAIYLLRVDEVANTIKGLGEDIQN